MLRGLKAFGLAGALLLLAVLAGCATPQVAALLARVPGELPQRAELSSTPFFPQEAHQCGPAALATVLSHEGVQVTPETLSDYLYLPARAGSLQAEMLGSTRRNGFVAYPLSGRLDDVLREVSAGTPVVVFQNLAFSIFPLWHYAVVIGYDLPANELVLRSGVTRRLTMSLNVFERTWARGDSNSRDCAAKKLCFRSCEPRTGFAPRRTRGIFCRTATLAGQSRSAHRPGQRRLCAARPCRGRGRVPSGSA